jgi:hypothetical protein
MTRDQNPTLQLPTERLQQIKNIGAVLGLSIADTVGHLIRAEVARGTIPDALPGINLARKGNVVVVGLDDETISTFSLSAARSLADTVAEFTVAEKAMQKLYNLDHDFMVERKGNGIKVTIPAMNGITKAFSFDVARDFARLVKEAAE